MCRLDASHRCLVVNKGCRLSPSTSLSSSWFLLLAYIAPVVGINRTRRLPTCRSHTLHSPFAYIARILLLLVLGSGFWVLGADARASSFTWASTWASEVKPFQSAVHDNSLGIALIFDILPQD